MNRLHTIWGWVFVQATLLTGVFVYQGLVAPSDCSAEEFVRTRTLFNLAGDVRAYLSLDPEKGVPQLSKTSSQSASGSYWEVRPIGRHRGYRVHLMVQRGNNRFNDRYLTVDPSTGQLMMTDDKDAEACRWLVRYAGRYQGYDAYYVQMLGKTQSEYDLAFLSVNEQGQVALHPHEPLNSAHWRMRAAPDLPSEIIR